MSCCCTCLGEDEIAIVESAGEYDRVVSSSGLHMLNPFACQGVAGRLSTRIQQVDVPMHVKTIDSYLLQVTVSVQYTPIQQMAHTANYRLSNVESQLSSYVMDGIRSKVPHLTLTQVFSEKEQWSQALQHELYNTFQPFGWAILHVLVVSVDLQPQVKRSIGQTRAEILQRPAERERAEARKAVEIKMSEAEAERAALSGQGTARAREAINRGYWESFEQLRQLEGMTREDTEAVMAALRQIETMKEMADSGNPGSDTYTIFPSDPASIMQFIRDVTEGKFILPPVPTNTPEEEFESSIHI